MSVSNNRILSDKYICKIHQIPTFIFEQQPRNSKNESMLVETLLRIQVNGSLHQNICNEITLNDFVKNEFINW